MENVDVFKRLFVQTLEGDVHKWFIELPLPLLIVGRLLNMHS
jgi:hypothetical protein